MAVEVRCAICGRQEELSKVHKDYARLKRDPTSIYVCHFCQVRVNRQAQEEIQPKKPI